MPEASPLARVGQTGHPWQTMSWNDDAGFDHTKDREPLFLWQGHPVYVAPFIVAMHVLAMVACVIAMSAHVFEVDPDHPGFSVLAVFGFVSPLVWHGWLWQPFTYGLVHDPRSALWFALEMYFLWTFGREVERFLGRRSFIRLYAILYLSVPLLLLLLSFLQVQAYAGSSAIHFAVFAAFATLYPNAAMFGSIPAKWVAVILVAVNACMLIAGNSLIGLMLLAESVGLAWAYVRWERGYLTLPKFRLPARKPKFRVLPHPSAAKPPRPATAPAVASPMDDVDALLDKIARSGMSSLSPGEREKLERASADLKKSGH